MPPRCSWRRGRGRGACLACLAWLGAVGPAPAAAQHRELVIEILPADGGDGPSPEELIAALQTKVSTAAGRAELGTYEMLEMLPDDVGEVESVGGYGEPAIDVSSASDWRSAAANDMQVTAGGDMRTYAAGDVGLRGGSLTVQTPGVVKSVSGKLDVQAGGDISALAAGDAELAAGEGRATLTGSLVAEAGDDVSLTGGGEFSLNVARSGSVSSGEGLEVAARSLDVQGRDGLTATAKSVGVTTDLLSVKTSGAMVELSGDEEIEYTGFTWRSSSSFDEFRNDFPVMKATQELIIRSISAESIPHVQSGVGTAVGIDVGFQTAGGLAWRTVWSADIGSGSYSVDGLRASWEEPLDVVAVRLTSAPPNGPTFTGWRTARLYFGRKVPAGSVSVRSASTLEAIVGEAMHVAANQLHVSGGEAVDLHGAALSVAGETLDVRTSSGLNAATGKLQLDLQETMDVFAAGAASITTDELETNVRTDAALLAGGRLSAAAAAVDLDVSDGLSVHARAADIGLADSLTASVASTLAVSARDASLQTESIRAFAEGETQLTADTASLATTRAALATQSADVQADTVRMWTDEFDVDATSGANIHAGVGFLSVDSEEASVSISGDISVQATGDTEMWALGGLSANVAEKLSLATDGAELRSLGEVGVYSGGDAEMNVDGDVSLHGKGSLDGDVRAVSLSSREGITANTGGALSSAAGGDVSLSGGGDGTLSVAGSLAAASDSMLLQTGSLRADSDSVEIKARDGLKMRSLGAAAELLDSDVSMHAAGSISALAGQSLEVASESVSLSAAATLEASAAGPARLAAESLQLQSAGKVSTTGESLDLRTAAGMDVFSGGDAAVDVAGLRAGVRGDVNLAAAGDLDVAAEAAKLGLSESAELSAQKASVLAEEELTAYAGERAALRTGDAEVVAGGLLSAMAVRSRTTWFQSSLNCDLILTANACGCAGRDGVAHGRRGRHRGDVNGRRFHPDAAGLGCA